MDISVLHPVQGNCFNVSLDYFLHPALAPDATAGRSIVNTTIKLVESFRKADMKVLWVNVSFYMVLRIPFS